MKRVLYPGFYKSWWLSFLIFLSTQAAGQISYNLSLTQSIKSDTFFLEFDVQHTSGNNFTFGNANFVVNADTSIFDLSKAVIVGNGLWNTGPDYQNLQLSYSNLYQTISLSILKGSSGVGVNVPNTVTQIGKVAIPIKKCNAITSITWRQVAPTGKIESYGGTDIRSNATFSNPVPLVSLCDLTMTTSLSVFPNDSICTGDSVRFVANVSSLYDKINFYKNGTLVQSSPSNSYTLLNPANGDQVYAVAVRCVCTASSTIVRLQVDNIQVNLGADQRLCKNPIALDAGTFAAGINYQWNTGATTRMINASSPGTYSVIAYRPGGCYDRDTIVIQPRLVIGTPYVTTGIITATSIQYSWDSDANASLYQYSTDSASWTNNTNFSYTVGNLTPGTSQCFWVRYINYCDTMVSQKVCATTLTNCKITYTKPKDTATCSPAGFTIGITNINPPSYKIAWNGNAASRTTTYNYPGAADATIRFTITDTAFAGCSRLDSIKINYVPVNDAGWAGLDANYCTASYSSVLIPNQPGGTFSGTGVGYNYTSNEWFFKPSVAGPGTFTITYTICGLSSSKTTTVQAAPCITSVVSDSSGSAVQTPQGLYTDCDGQIYVSNAQNDIISLIDTLGHAHVVAGDSNFAGAYADGPVNTTGRINDPIGVIVGPDGTIYFVDSGNQAIRMVKNGVISTLAGAPPPAATAGDIPNDLSTVTGSTARFKKPYGIAFNNNYTKLYVSDQGNRKIREIDLSPPYNVRTVVGGGATTITTAGVLGTSAAIFGPTHLSSDANYLYFADETANNVFKYDYSSGQVMLYAGTGMPGNQIGYTTGATPAAFYQPSGLSVNCDGDVYVADKGNNSIKLIDPNTYSPQVYVSNFAGSNNPTQPPPVDVDGPPSVARFNQPQEVSIFVKGFIDIADTGNDKIKRLSIQDYSQRPWQNFQSDFTYCTDDKADTLSPPCGGVYSGPGIVSTGGVYVFNPALAGAGFHTITYVYTTGYCVETSTQKITVYPKPQPQIVSDSMVCSNQFGSYQLDAGSGFASYTWYKNGTVDPSSAIQYYTVKSLGTYSVNVTNIGGCVGTAQITLHTKPVPIVSIAAAQDSVCYGGSSLLTATAQIASPNSITSYTWNTGSSGNSQIVSSSGDYIVTANASNGCSANATHRVTVKSAPLTCITASTLVGTDLGYGTYSASTLAGPNAKGNAKITFSSIGDLYYDKTSNYLYVTEAGSRNDVRKIKLSDTTATTLAGMVSAGGYADGASGIALFNKPYGIVGKPNGLFYVADSSNQVIRVINSSSNQVTSLAGKSPLAGMIDGKDTSARFNGPYDLVTDIFGNLFTTDYNNNKIRKISPQGVVITYAGDSSNAASAGSANGVSYAARFNHPKGISFDSEGNLYVSDVNGLRKISRDTVVSTYAAVLNNPENIAIDNQGNIFISDVGSSSVKMINKAGVMSTIYSNIHHPGGITIDPVTNKIFVAEVDSNRILTLTKNKTVVICEGDSIKINASCSNADSYQWTPSNGLSSSTSANLIANPVSTTTYYLTVTKGSCSNTDSIVVVVNPKPVANAGTDTTFCFNGIKQMGIITAGPYKFTWTTSPVANAGLSSTTISNPKAKPTASGIFTYFLNVKDTITQCTNNDNATITVNPKPVANAGKDTSVCEGKSVQIGSATVIGLTYKWSPNTWLSKDTISSPVSTPMDTITYALIVTTTAQCSDTDSVTVIFNPKPFAGAGTDTTLCLGASKQLGTTKVIGNTYSWSSSPVASSGLNAANIYNPVATPTAVNTYQYVLTVTDSLGCQNTSTSQIIVNPVPVHYALQNFSICKGDSVTIGTAGPYTFAWAPKLGLNDSTLATPHASPATDTTYIVTKTLGTCLIYDSVKVKVNLKPIVNPGPDRTMCMKDSVLIGGNIADYTAYTYKWKSTVPSPKDTLATTYVSPGSSVTDTLIITDKKTGCFSKDSVKIIVYNLPMVNAGLPKVICNGDSTQIGSALINGLHYQWSSVSVPKDTLANLYVSPNTTGYFTLQVTDSNSCKNRDSVLVTVNPKPVAAFISGSACATDTVRFTAGPTIPVTYNWDFGDGTSVIGNINDTLHTYASSNNYTVKLLVTSAFGCTDSVSANLAVNKKPLVDFTYNLACGGLATFTDASASADTTTLKNWYWDFGDGTNDASQNPPVHSYPNAGNHTAQLIVTTSHGCKDTVQQIVKVRYLKITKSNDTIVCSGFPAKLLSEGTGGTYPFTYSWADSSSSGTGSIANMADSVTTVLNKIAGRNKYYITVTTAGGCVANDSVVVTVRPLPVADAGKDTAICAGKSVVIGGNTPSGTIMWTPNIWLDNNTLANPLSTPQHDTTYVVTVTDTTSSHCVNSDTMQLKVNPLPVVVINKNQPVACNGTLFVLSVDPTNRPYNINWTDVTSGNISMATDTIHWGVSVNGDYKVVIRNPITGCADSSTTNVTFVTPPSGLTIQGPDSNCINAPLTLLGSSAGDSLHFKWTTNGLGLFTDSSTAATQYIPDPSDPTPIHFKLVAYNSCSNLAAFDTVILNPAPIGSFSYTPPQSFANDTVSFLNASDTVLYSIRKWLWDFKDGSTDNNFDPQHAFANPGIYNVNLTVTNKYGCFYNYSLPLEIYDIHVLFIPNAFSPFATNAENRTCKIYGEKIAPDGFNFRIYNRWGDLVYETSNLAEAKTVGWDGTNKDKEEQSMGVFTYVVNGQWIDGRKLEKTGTVTLIK